MRHTYYIDVTVILIEMVQIFRTFAVGVTLSIASSLVFIAGMYVIGSIRLLSHSFPVSIFLFCIPLLMYSIRIKSNNVIHVFILILYKSIWIVTPVCLLIGYVLATFPMNEFDIHKPFDYYEFFWFSAISSIPLFVITFVTLLVGSQLAMVVHRKKITKSHVSS